MFIYEEAAARYVGRTDPEVEAAMLRVQDKHHNRLVNEVMDLIHEELMDARDAKEEDAA